MEVKQEALNFNHAQAPSDAGSIPDNRILQSVVKLTRYTVTAVSGGTYSLF
jgi:hypothetical protein